MEEDVETIVIDGIEFSVYDGEGEDIKEEEGVG